VTYQEAIEQLQKILQSLRELLDNPKSEMILDKLQALTEKTGEIITDLEK